MKSIKVSFDYDGTLDLESVQEYAKTLLERGVEVHIVSCRAKDKNAPKGWNDDLKETASLLGIPEKNIHLLEHNNKYSYFESNPGFAFHLDDDHQENKMINENTFVTAVDRTHGWKDRCGHALELFHIRDELQYIREGLVIGTETGDKVYINMHINKLDSLIYRLQPNHSP